MKRISKEETEYLNKLYERANENDSNDDWVAIQIFFKRLAVKYDFDVEKFYINKFGRVMEIRKCFKCGLSATTTDGTIYVRDKVNGRWDNYPICWSCYSRHYPEKAMQEVDLS